MRENLMECSDLVRKMDLLRQKCIEAEEKAETIQCPPSCPPSCLQSCPESNLYYYQYLDHKSELKLLENRYENQCKGMFSLFVHRIKFGW
jgi:hypothetical protein